ARPVTHPGGNLDREALALFHGARAGAMRAGAHALPARAPAGGARRRPPDRHRRLRTADRGKEVDLDRMLDVIAPVGCAARGRSAAEHLGEDVAEAPLRLRLPAPPARSRLPEVEAEALEPLRSGTKGEAVSALAPPLVLARPARVESGLEPCVPELVVELPLLGVGEGVVGEGDVLEPLLRLLAPSVQIRMVLPGELAVRLLDLIGRGGLRHAEHGVQILLIRHRSRWTATSFGVLEPDPFGRDLAQGGDDLLVVRLNERPRALEQLLRPAGGEQDELETVRNMLQAVFDGDACHRVPSPPFSRHFLTEIPKEGNPRAAELDLPRNARYVPPAHGISGAPA